MMSRKHQQFWYGEWEGRLTRGGMGNKWWSKGFPLFLPLFLSSVFYSGPLSSIRLSFKALLFLLPLLFFILLLRLLSQPDHLLLLPLFLTPYSLWLAFALCSLPWLCLDSAACLYEGRWIEAIFFLSFLSACTALQFFNSYSSLLLPPPRPPRKTKTVR